MSAYHDLPIWWYHEVASSVKVHRKSIRFPDGFWMPWEFRPFDKIWKIFGKMNSCLKGQILMNYRSESTSSVIFPSCRLMRMYVTTYFEIAIRHKKGESPPKFWDRVVSANFEFGVAPLCPLQYFCCSDGCFFNSEHSKGCNTNTPQSHSVRKVWVDYFIICPYKHLSYLIKGCIWKATSKRICLRTVSTDAVEVCDL